MCTFPYSVGRAGYDNLYWDILGNRKEAKRIAAYALPKRPTSLASLLLRIAAGGMLAAALSIGLFGMSASTDAQAADPPIVVHFDGEPLELDIAPNLQAGTTLVQMRPIFEALGMELTWNPGARTITAVKEGYHLSMTLDSDRA
jgi:hypothetical protein